MAEENYSPIFPNSEVRLSDRDCYNCLLAYYEHGDPQAVSCVMFTEKPLKVQCAEEHCEFRVWDFSIADKDTLKWIAEYEQNAKKNHAGYKDQIKGVAEIRRLLKG